MQGMLCSSPALPALRNLGEGGSFIEGVECAGIQLCRVGLAPPIVIPAKAGIQMPSLTGLVIFAQTPKLRFSSISFGPNQLPSRQGKSMVKRRTRLEGYHKEPFAQESLLNPLGRNFH